MAEYDFERLGGIRPTVGTTFCPPTPAEVEAIEKQIEARLPDSYRAFITRFGRSSFNEYVDFIPVSPFPDSPEGNGHLGLFFGGQSETHKSFTLQWNLDTYSRRLPSGLVPIGTDGGGDLICLGISDEIRGKVFYWDHTREPLDDEASLEDYGRPMTEADKISNVSLIAESFDDFLQRLVVSSNS